MIVTGNENHQISLADASEMTKRYRDSAGENAIIAHMFGESAITAILNQEGCLGIRIYYGLDENGKKQLVITGVDSSGNDLYNGLLADRSACCPSMCSASNPLNS